MKRNPHKQKQQTPQELRDRILEFIDRKFYPGRQLAFRKDIPRLLKWVVLKLAAYLDERGVTLSAARYQEIMIGDKGILMEALRFGNTGSITYMPAWLGKTVESHLRIHGEDYYEEGKALRGAVENALTIARNGVQGREPDPVGELAAASRLLRPKRRPGKVPENGQLTML